MGGIVVIGPDMALLEGLAQTLSAAGYRPVIASSIADAANSLGGSKAFIAVIDRQELVEAGSIRDLPLAHGGALIVFHDSETVPAPLPHRIQRMTIAFLELPLERQRLMALVRYIEGRAKVAGREAEDESLPDERGVDRE
ncbi:MAG: hypothetical protein M3Q09_07700 [Gemmatimonadota bacterium]|nr:hypothetical protein [Gemmatimonadota bacterium]